MSYINYHVSLLPYKLSKNSVKYKNYVKDMGRKMVTDELWYSTYATEFVKRPLLPKDKDILFEKILMHSRMSADLLTKVNKEFIKNKRNNIISPIQRYYLLTSICMNPTSAFYYLTDIDGAMNIEKPRLLRVVIKDEQHFETLVKYLGGELKLYFKIIFKTPEFDLMIDKILSNNNLKLAKILYNCKQLSEEQKDLLAPLVVAMKLSKKI